jgi:hypothetical protein|tara:strand:- start:18 stop:893 length:876 start_codon:yes stop_codon:yes gene_type:complete
MSKIEVSLDQLKETKIFIGTPMYGAQCAGTYTKASTDLAMMCAANGIGIQFYYLFNESLIQRARNYIADEFMRSDCTHLLFIDADIGFNPRDVLGLLAVNITDPDKYNVVTGLYPKKTIAWEKVSKAAQQGIGKDNPFDLDEYTADFVFNPVQQTNTFSMADPLEVGEAGTGFMLIPRATFEKFKEAYPELSYRPDHVRTESFDGTRDIHAYFDCIIDPETRRYLSEDYFFCKKSRQAGMKIWACPWMQLQHIGSYIFKGNLGKIGSLGSSLTADASARKTSYNKKSNKRK